MKIFTLSLDTSVLDPKSKTASRISRYGTVVEKYSVLVPTAFDAKVTLAENVTAYGTSGKSKIAQLFHGYVLGKILLSEEKYDVLSVQDQYYVALLGLVLARSRKIGFEVQVHGFEKFGGVRARIARYVLKRADGIRAVSERLKKQLVSEFGIAPEKITVAPVYVEVHRDGLTPKQDSTHFVFLTVSRLVPIKDIPMQLDALAELVAWHPNLRLNIVGDGPELEQLEHYAAALGITSFVRFLGRQTDVAEFYREADVFMLTSNKEGWGMTIVEAASFGLPIIMTDVGCAGEFIYTGENGIVIPVGNKKALVEAMKLLIDSESERKLLGGNARIAALKLPSFDEMLRRYVAGWNNVLMHKR